MLRKRRADRRANPSEVIGERREKRNQWAERRQKRRAFFIKLTGNVKWIMLFAAVIAVILFAKFGLPSLLIPGI